MYLLLELGAWLIVGALSVLGSLGNLALYEVGEQGVDAIRKRFPHIMAGDWQRVQGLYGSFGDWVLVLSGVPVLGSLLAAAAGAFGVPLPVFLILVTIGKMWRNWLLVILLAGTYNFAMG